MEAAEERTGALLLRVAENLFGGAALVDAAVATLREAGRTDDALQQTRIGDAAIAVTGGSQWLEWAARRADASALGGALSPQVSAEEMVTAANMTRTAIERICLQVLDLVERIGRDLTLYLRQPAPDAALRDAGQFALGQERPSLTWWDLDPAP